MATIESISEIGSWNIRSSLGDRSIELDPPATTYLAAISAPRSRQAGSRHLISRSAIVL
jgi:hypothetical protein